MPSFKERTSHIELLLLYEDAYVLQTKKFSKQMFAELINDEYVYIQGYFAY